MTSIRQAVHSRTCRRTRLALLGRCAQFDMRTGPVFERCCSMLRTLAQCMAYTVHGVHSAWRTQCMAYTVHGVHSVHVYSAWRTQCMAYTVCMYIVHVYSACI